MLDYIKRQELRELGFDQLENEFLPLLDKFNQQIAVAIEKEIPKEIKQNYNKEILNIYFNLIKEYQFSSSIVQHWLKKNIAALDEITADYKELIFHRIQKSLNQIRGENVVWQKG